MTRNLTTLILGFYFFFYLIPQYIVDVYYVYDRYTIQLLYLSLLNIITTGILIFKGEFNSLLLLIKKNSHILSYSFFIIIAIVSAFKAENYIESIVVLSKFITLFISFVLVLFLASNKKLNFLNLFIYFTVIGILFESYSVNSSVYENVINNGNFLGRSMDYRGFTGNPNITSFAITMKLPVLVYLIFNLKNKYILGLVSLLLSFSLLAIILLFSRAALIALFLVLIFIVLYVTIKRTKTNLIKFSIIIFAIISSVFTYDFFNEKNTTDLISTRFSSVTDPSSDESVNERLNFYKIAIEDIKNNPILGVGIGNWKLTSIQPANKFLNGYRIPYRVHNDFLEVMAETGIIGGLCFIYFICYPFWFSFKKAFYAKKFDLYCLICLVVGVYLVDSMLNFPMHRPIIICYLFFIFAVFNNLKTNQSQ